MSGYPSPGQYNNNRYIMNGGPKPHDPYQPQMPGHSRYNNHGVAPDYDSHYTNPYTDKHHTNGLQTNKNKHSNTNGNKMAIHRPRLNRKNAPDQKTKTNLTTNFDPMKDRHMWTMWRTAVNGRIVDQVRKNEQYKQDALIPPDEFSSTAGVSDAKTHTTYGKDLASAPPLSRFIRLNQRSKNIAQELMNEGHGKLETTQFIYYGLPRVTVSSGNNNRYNNNSNSNSYSNDNNIYGAQNGHNGYAQDVSNMNFYNGDGGGPRVQSL